METNNFKEREPLAEYPWRNEVDRLLTWLLNQDSHVKSFCFDVIMSAAYIDATSGIEKAIQECSSLGQDYNAHLGFTNLCSPCYVSNMTWTYQKAAKPQSGALGKLSSEIILRFIEKSFSAITKVTVIGGTSAADALLYHEDGLHILAEVKSAPLMTYPFLFKIPETSLRGKHDQVTITNSQLNESQSAMYFPRVGSINLGKVGGSLWPFKPIVDFFIDDNNKEFIEKCIAKWLEAKKAYTNRDRESEMYYLSNACGSPPTLERRRDNWPDKHSISDGKTSAGMDRTDDIKKGIYQCMKMGVALNDKANTKTAIISNLPAYRHGREYVAPFTNILWGREEDLCDLFGEKVLLNKDLYRVFDYIITLEDPILRNLKL